MLRSLTLSKCSSNIFLILKDTYPYENSAPNNNSLPALSLSNSKFSSNNVRHHYSQHI